jgi:hypothetical protein
MTEAKKHSSNVLLLAIWWKMPSVSVSLLTELA